MSRLKVERIKFYVLLLILVPFQPTVRGRHFRGAKDAHELRRVNRSNNITQQQQQQQRNTEQQILSSEKKENLQKGTDLSPDAIKSHDDDGHDKIVLPAVTLKSSAELTNGTGQSTAASPKQQPIGGHLAPLDPGALLRGFYVFLGLTVLLMAYIVFRSFRLGKTHAQMVRKYGILAHRQDVEMRPLPLDEEDDEDTTVFDASNIPPTNDNQRQIL